MAMPPDPIYAMVGAYEVNPRNLDKDFTLILSRPQTSRASRIPENIHRASGG